MASVPLPDAGPDVRAVNVSLSVLGVPGIPPIVPGDDLADIIIEAMDRRAVTVADGDIVVVAQKIVSKSEDRYVDLAAVTPSPRARELAAQTGKDARLVEVILGESAEVVRHGPGVLVVAHRLGFVMANAGVDASNLEPAGDGGERVLLLPRDPNATSARLRSRLEARFRRRVGVIISDSVGRAWRNGSIGMALGAAGPPALWDRIGDDDLYGRPLRITQVGYADQIAAAASLVMGEGAEGLPVVKVGGLSWQPVSTDASLLLRPPEQDLFR